MAKGDRSLVFAILGRARVVLFGESLRVVAVRERACRRYHQLNNRPKKPGRSLPLDGGIGGGGGEGDRPFRVTDKLKELPE